MGRAGLAAPLVRAVQVAIRGLAVHRGLAAPAVRTACPALAVPVVLAERMALSSVQAGRQVQVEPLARAERMAQMEHLELVARAAPLAQAARQVLAEHPEVVELVEKLGSVGVVVRAEARGLVVRVVRMVRTQADHQELQVLAALVVPRGRVEPQE